MPDTIAPDTVADAQARQQALDPMSSYCVTAPAGSGKTELLIQRYLVLLARVQKPEEVLAITFTRKAAAEMRARVVEALARGRDSQPPEGAHHRQTWELAQAVLALDEDRQWHLSSNPGRFNIRTIDGFCAHLTRQMPVLSRFGGAMTPSEQPDPAYRQATRALLDRMGTGDDYATDIKTLLLHFDGNWQRLEAALIRMLVCRDQWLVSMGAGQLNRERAETVLEHSVNLVVGDCLGEAARLLELWAEELHGILSYSREQRGLPEMPWPEDDPADWQPLVDLLLKQDNGWRKTVNVRQGFPPGDDTSKAMKDALAEVISAMAEDDATRQALVQVRGLPRQLPDDRHWQLVLAASRVLPLLAAELNLAFQQRGEVDYTEVSIAALSALGGDEQPTELALKLDYQLQHILVDEFQDTAVNQYELVRRLSRGWATHNEENPGNPRTLFIVGDGMQSIYGFRDADVGLFMRARDQGFDELKLQPLVLQSNFRSQAGLVDWVNREFCNVFPPRDDVRCGEISFSSAVAERLALPGEAVTMAAFERGEEAGPAEARWLAGRIEEGMADPDCQSMAVLVRTRNHFRHLAGELKARGIGWQAQDIDLLADSLVVRDLMSLLRAMHNHGDRVAWLAILRAPWCGLGLGDLHRLACCSKGRAVSACLGEDALMQQLSTPAREAVTRLAAVMGQAARWREVMGLSRSLQATWHSLGGPACAESGEGLAEAAALLELLRDMDDGGTAFDLEHIEEQVAALYAPPGGGDSKLQLMTLHKSKGLEFDWVFIPALERRPASDRRELLLWDDYHSLDGSEVGFMLAVDDFSERHQPTLYNYLQRQRQHKREQEATRLLYVGVTRAAKRLFLSASVTAGGKDGDEVGAGEGEGTGAREWRKPVQRSLLARLWDGFGDTLKNVQPALDEVQPTEVGATGMLRRLVKFPGWKLAEQAEDSAATMALAVHTAARETGNLLHLSLQRLSLSPLPTPDELDIKAWRTWWNSRLPRLALTPEEKADMLDRVENAVLRVLNDERGRWMLSSERVQVASEYRLSTAGEGGEQGTLAEHVIDRTFVEDSQRWIIDYKSSVPESGESLDAFGQRQTELYGGQLARYRAALQAKEDLPARTALYFPALPHWLEIP